MRSEAASPATGERGRGRHLGDWLGVAWLLLFVLLYLSPALKDGPSFAPSDLGAGLSNLTSGAVALSSHCVAPPGGLPIATCPHDNVNGDQITQAIPWNTTNYRLLHAGEFPWWNDLEGNGLPQFLNFESAPLALPSLLSDLAPLSISFLLLVAVKLLIAGLGTYWCCRLLGARPLAAALGGTAFMLSGPLTSWIGWSISSTLCWSGAILGALIWAYRSPRRAAPVVLLAIGVAFAIYGGFAEAYVLLAGFFALVLGGSALAKLARRERPDPRGAGRIALGVACGLALAAPLWLPGIAVLRASIRSGTVSAHGILAHGLALIFAQGYDGLPIAGSTYFGGTGVGALPNYFEATSYVGVVVLILAGVAVLCRWRRPAVFGIGLATLASLLVVYRLSSISPVQRLVVDLHLGAIDVDRALSLLALGLALLAGLGAEQLLEGFSERATRRALLVSGALVTAVVAFLGAKALGGLAQPWLALRQASLYWPVATLLILAALTLLLFASHASTGRMQVLLAHRAELLGGAMLALESAFLLFAGVGINSYSPAQFPATPATTTLARLVGHSLVALDQPLPNVSCFRLTPATGFYPAMNIGYGIDELAVHDPTAPAAYFSSWPIKGVGQLPVSSCPPGQPNVFAPSVNTVALARQYGASYVLVDPSVAPPKGMTRVGKVGDETLYAVPGSSRFTFVRAGAPSGDTVSSVTHPGDATYDVKVHAAKAAVLEARITDSPGWGASAGGHRLKVTRFGGTFLGIAVPAGTTVLTLTYRPPHLAPSLGLALAGLLALVAYALAARRRGTGGGGENLAPVRQNVTAPL